MRRFGDRTAAILSRSLDSAPGSVNPPRARLRQTSKPAARYERESPRAQWTAAASSSTTRTVPTSKPASAVIAQSIVRALNVPCRSDGYGCGSSSRSAFAVTSPSPLRRSRLRRRCAGGTTAHALASKSSSCIWLTPRLIVPSMAARASPRERTGRRTFRARFRSRATSGIPPAHHAAADRGEYCRWTNVGAIPESRDRQAARRRREGWSRATKGSLLGKNLARSGVRGDVADPDAPRDASQRWSNTAR